MYSEPYANKNKLVTFLIPEIRKKRLSHQRHEMGSDRRKKNCKYWNLHAVVMSDCSLIATRNSHAKHNKLVGRIPEHRQARDYYAKENKRSYFGSGIKGRNSWNLTACTNTHNRLKVRNTSRTCQKIIKPLSMRWAPTSKRLLRKGLQTIMFRLRNQGSKLVKSYRLHKHTR